MKLNAAFSILIDMRFAIFGALPGTLKFLVAHPAALWRPKVIADFFMGKVWETFAEGTDGNGKPEKEILITPHARGVVLDIGAGHGHTAYYLDHDHVTRYVALEPNVYMHPHIRGHALKAGFKEDDGSLVILTCGAEDAASIASALPEGVDTLVSVLTLCTVPRPSDTLQGLVTNTLKSGGEFLWYEHVQNPRLDVRWWQGAWSGIWVVLLGGCRLGQDTEKIVREVGAVEGEGNAWSEVEVWDKAGEPDEHLFWHRVGRCVKK